MGEDGGEREGAKIGKIVDSREEERAEDAKEVHGSEGGTAKSIGSGEGETPGSDRGSTKVVHNVEMGPVYRTDGVDRAGRSEEGEGSRSGIKPGARDKD